MADITLPIKPPRPYQRSLWTAYESGIKRMVSVWHRRAGKDTEALGLASVAAHERVGTYWHMLPTLRQGRKVIWEGIDRDGNRHLDAFPGWRRPGTGVVDHIRHDEMKIELKNGSIWQVVGSDSYDALVGSNPIGVVFSEYSIADPAAWEFIRPILTENEGWALFIYTPRGRNHGHHLYKMARDNPDWFAELLTVDDTGTITAKAIDEERRAGMPEELVQQEFWCSWDAPLVGSIYSEQMFKAHNEGRITTVHWDSSVLVETWWDLGRSDSTAVWFVQHVGNEIHVIDYYQAEGKEPADLAAMLDERKDRGWRFGAHIWPHDGNAVRQGMGHKSLADQMREHGYDVSVQSRPTRLEDIWAQINRVRAVLPRCWFDEKGCELGLDALKSYRKEEDENRSTIAVRYFKEQPHHDWASHGSDAFRVGVNATRHTGGRTSKQWTRPLDLPELPIA